jgi:hypothetical protein
MKNTGVLLLSMSLVFGISLQVIRCGKTQLAGGASETENVAGTIVTLSGAPAPAARVLLLPSTYSPLSGVSANGVYIDTTDDSGRYRFSRVGRGTYSLEGVQPSSVQRCLRQNIAVAGGSDSVTLAADTLRTPGTIIVTLPSGWQQAGGYLYLPGTTIGVRIDSGAAFAGIVELDSVPAAGYAAVWYTPASGSASSGGTVSGGVTVASGGTDTVAGWPHSTMVTINTSLSGANVTGDLIAVPLLIRLTSSNFQFSQAPGASVKGIAFASAGGAALPYQIERWDSAGAAAEVWVAVDTIHGNSASQYIRFFWGATGSDSSSGAAVFPVSQGWAGAWHLEESAPDTATPGLYRNAVEAANNGDDYVLSNGKTGTIGLGQTFWDGDRIQVTNATARLKPALVTLSAWVRLLRTDSLSSDIASMGDNYMLRIDKVNNSPKFVLYNMADTPQIICQDSSLSLADSAWHYMAGTFDGANVCLYVDGILTRTVPYAGAIEYNLGPDFMIGVHGDYKKGFNFIGSLDEVECSSVARSAAWIKFSYENQVPGSSIANIVNSK